MFTSLRQEVLFDPWNPTEASGPCYVSVETSCQHALGTEQGRKSRSSGWWPCFAGRGLGHMLQTRSARGEALLDDGPSSLSLASRPSARRSINKQKYR